MKKIIAILVLMSSVTAFAGSYFLGLKPVDTMDLPIIDTTVMPIPGGSYQRVVAKLAEEVHAVKIYDSTGEFIGVYAGDQNAVSTVTAPTFVGVVGLGEDANVNMHIAKGQSVYIRSYKGPLSTGDFSMTFLGI